MTTQRKTERLTNAFSGNSGGASSGGSSGGGGDQPGWAARRSDIPPNRQTTWSLGGVDQFKLTVGVADKDGTNRQFSSWEMIPESGKNGPKTTFMEHRYMPGENYGMTVSGAKQDGPEKSKRAGGFLAGFKEKFGGS